MTIQKKLFKVTGELHKDQLEFKVSAWKLLIETNRYYEIKPLTGTAVKRLYKEKLNAATTETQYYANGALVVSAFCMEEYIEEIQQRIIDQLESKIDIYMHELTLNRKAIEGVSEHLRKEHVSSVSST
ncbi:hypothetical protein ACFQ3W_18065 [Paenibacillus puldeungensis]|uniref:Uncharacterized protein n=1 Tax=Paenibacillus puldeungensis TaxID=696536 RepID=A0ABW3S171_9BACL